MSGLPASAYPLCLYCNKPLATIVGALHEIKGFEREREAGGTNHVIARRRTGALVCSLCAPRVQAGVPVEQGSLV